MTNRQKHTKRKRQRDEMTKSPKYFLDPQAPKSPMPVRGKTRQENPPFTL